MSRDRVPGLLADLMIALTYVLLVLALAAMVR